MTQSFAFYSSPDSPNSPSLLSELPTVTDSVELDNYSGFFSYQIVHEDPCLTFSAMLDGKLSSFHLDFTQGKVAYRRQHGGGRKQHIAKACGLKHNWTPNIIDATAGLGRDAAELRSLGCSMRLIERSPFVASLLEDAINRAAEANPELFGSNFELFQGQSLELIRRLSQEQQPDIIYLDPMFPPRNKSAAVKKEMRLVKLLVGNDPDADELLPIALDNAKYRVVVKRPSYAPYLNEMKPSMSIESKGNRFDVYVLKGIN
ncbi:class I SAM-dependent methyltransferase [Kangiella sediminilitoris]|uniref:Ribosomal RNA small subunit methyltransferase J n=1 Tax=Kangiella sediminilitoris TaxID=1144748 RepID=A0A1B3BDS3_9GAMM|nr:class I SAM-dependent methyltransferase [Kangiella sediminilitoris]AOE50961.1 Ribosomal RNA small subunit methyltransferase J [Kangiella sediminilitoris]